jgi:hypothetical protein
MWTCDTPEENLVKGEKRKEETGRRKEKREVRGKFFFNKKEFPVEKIAKKYNKSK